MKCRLFWLFLIFLGQHTLWAQSLTKYADSLLKKVPYVPDTTKIKIYREMVREFMNVDLGKAVEYGEKSIELSRKYNLPESEANVLDMLGSVFAYQGSYTKGLEYKLKALDIYKRIGNKKGLTQLNNNVGVLHFRNQNYQQALAHYEVALKMAREIGNEEGESTYLLNIGEVYQKLNLWEKAIQYEEASLKISEKLGIGENKGYALGILGQVYKAQGKFEQAIAYQKEAIKILNKVEDYTAEAEYLVRLAETYTAQKDFINAQKYAFLGLQKANEIQAIEWQKEAYHVLSDIYAIQGDSVVAYRYHKKYAVLKDSIFRESMVQQLAKLQSLYKVSEQQARIDLLTKDKIIQEEVLYIRTLFLYVASVAIILITLFIWGLYRANTRKRRDNKLLAEQKNEIQRINDDITSSIAYAKRIQEAMLPTQAQLKQALPEHFILFEPRDVVSGDFYWFQEKNDLLFLAAIDCTGHGVPGAFMSMMGDALLNQIVLDKSLQHPDLILNEMHREIRKTLRQDDNENKDGMDLALVVLDLQNKQLEFAGAHCPLIFVQHNQLHYVKGDRLSVGGFQPELERIFTRYTLPIDSETVFYIFSDGYQDQFGGENRRKYSSSRFRELLYAIHALPTEEQKKHLWQETLRWRSECNERQIDDILIIGVKVLV